jgi:hypothetical protein
MLLQDHDSGKLVEILATNDLYNPLHPRVVGRLHYGEEAQDPDHFDKGGLRFPSGEPLPRSWIDPHYRDAELDAARRRGVAG